MQSRNWFVAVLVLVVGFTAMAASVAPAQTASGEFNKIVQAMEQHYYSCAEGLKGKAAKQAYIDHGKLEMSRWEAFLSKYGDSKQAFYARCYLARALEMAKEMDRAKEVVQETRKEIKSLRHVKALADAAQVVYHSNEVPTEVLEQGIAQVSHDEDKAELQMELLRYIATPKNAKRKDKKTLRKKRHIEIVTTAAKTYPKTRCGKEAASMLAGFNMKVGDPIVNLKHFRDEAGKDLDLDAYKGKVLVLLFWTGRSKSKRSLTKMVAMHTDLGPKGLEIVGINCDYGEDKDRNMDSSIQRYGIKWRNYHDGEKLRNKVALTFYVRVFPTTIVVGKDGKVAAIGESMEDLPDIVGEQLGK